MSRFNVSRSYRSIGLLIGVGVLFMMLRGRQIRPPTTQSRRARAQPEGSRTADCASSAYSSKKSNNAWTIQSVCKVTS